MCGIVGVIGGDPAENAVARDALTHRGPDAAGAWSEGEVWLGHRRLSIIDLSPSGSQPMISACGRWVLVYNGEVYNYEELRNRVPAARFAGTSDTEVVLACIASHGLVASLPWLNGIFAFAAYDRERRELHLVRDRMGVKPLYVTSNGRRLAFASELRALLKLPWLVRSVDQAAVADVLRYGCVAAPRSILKGVRQVAPGAHLTWNGSGMVERRWWSVADAIVSARDQPFRGDLEAAAEEGGAILDDAVRMQMVADVPLGAFLSGGLDSASVVASMQAQSSQAVRTFTISFPGTEQDESAAAAAVARHLGTIHQEIPLDAMAARDLVPYLADLCDEPFADNSILPTWLLCRETRRSVTVALSGDGGDELFGGYPRYFWAERIAGWRGRLGPTLSGLVGQALGCAGGRARRLGGYLRCSPERVYPDMVAYWADPGRVLASDFSDGDMGPDPSRYEGLPWSRQMMACDQAAYLPDDILTKVDRASMAVSLEARVPLLDHRLVEWSWRLPPHLLMSPRGERGKLVLREILYRRVPRHLIERPKRGFGMPIGQWLRGPLRPWAEDLLAPSVVAAAGMLDAPAVTTTWQDFLSGRATAQQVWTILMLQQWHARWLR